MNKESNKFRKVMMIGVSAGMLILSGVTFSSCGGGGAKSGASAEGDSTVAAEQSNEKKSDWTYSEEEDKMNNSKNYFAKNVSPTVLHFQPPFDDDTYATLTVMNQEGQNDVQLSVSQGQFNADDIDGGSVRVKFDNEAPVEYSIANASDNSTDVLFIKQADKFIKKLKQSKKVIIEAEFFQDGSRQMDFNVSDLEWNH